MRATANVTVTDEQRRLLDEQGFFITDVLFDEDTLATLRAEFMRLWEANIAACRTQDERALYLAESRPFICRLDHQSDVCDAFCRHPVFIELCRQLIGPDADMSWNQAILKPPGYPDNNFAWHQDNWYAEKGDYAKDSNLDMLRRNDTGFTCWVAVTRTTIENGTLWVLPEHHKQGLLPHVWSDERREWQGQYDTSTKQPAVMQAGQVLIFRRYTPHASGANVSDETRMAYQIGYCKPGLKLKPSIDLAPVLRDNQPLKRGERTL